MAQLRKMPSFCMCYTYYTLYTFYDDTFRIYLSSRMPVLPSVPRNPGAEADTRRLPRDERYAADKSGITLVSR